MAETANQMATGYHWPSLADGITGYVDNELSPTCHPLVTQELDGIIFRNGLCMVCECVPNWAQNYCNLCSTHQRSEYDKTSFGTLKSSSPC